MSGSNKREIKKPQLKYGDQKHNLCYAGKFSDKHQKTASSLCMDYGGGGAFNFFTTTLFKMAEQNGRVAV